MYESYGNAQMAGGKLAQSQQYSQNIINSPQFGGDCALKQDGLSSSTKRLQDVAAQLLQASWQLRAFFGMDVAETGCDTPRPSGFKGDVDEAINASRASLENITLILEHLRS